MAAPLGFLDGSGRSSSHSVAAPKVAIVLPRGDATALCIRASQRPRPGFSETTLAAAPILINHQVWRCTIASVCALIVIGVAAVFGAVYTQTSAVGLRQLEGHLDAALPVNRSKEVCSSSRQCGLDDNSVRFTAAMEVGVSISLRAGFMRAQVGTIWRSIDTSSNPNQHSELSNPKHHLSTNIGAGSASSRYQHLLTKPV